MLLNGKIIILKVNLVSNLNPKFNKIKKILFKLLIKYSKNHLKLIKLLIKMLNQLIKYHYRNNKMIKIMKLMIIYRNKKRLFSKKD